MALISRVADCKAIERRIAVSGRFAGLQQLRWPPSLVADSPRKRSNKSRVPRFPAIYVTPRFRASPEAWRHLFEQKSLGLKWDVADYGFAHFSMPPLYGRTSVSKCLDHGLLQIDGSRKL